MKRDRMLIKIKGDQPENLMVRFQRSVSLVKRQLRKRIYFRKKGISKRID